MSTLTSQEIKHLRDRYRKNEISVEEYVKKLSQGRFEKDRMEFLKRYGKWLKDLPSDEDNDIT